MRSCPSVAANSTKGPGIFRPDIHVHAAINIVADRDALAALGHGVRVENLVAQRRPENAIGLRLLGIILGAACHHLVARQDGAPVGAGQFPIHRFAGELQGVVRCRERRGDVVSSQGGKNARGECAMSRGHDLAAQGEPLGVTEQTGLSGVCGILRLELLTLLFGENRCACPDDEIGGFPAHQRRPELSPLIEDVVEVQACLASDRAARVQIEVVQLNECRVRVRYVPADDGMAPLFECA